MWGQLPPIPYTLVPPLFHVIACASTMMVWELPPMPYKLVPPLFHVMACTSTMMVLSNGLLLLDVVSRLLVSACLTHLLNGLPLLQSRSCCFGWQVAMMTCEGDLVVKILIGTIPAHLLFGAHL
jgi:hypothetical protein